MRHVRLHVTIDASPVKLSEGRGYRRYVLALLRALAEDQSYNTYHILSWDTKPQDDFINNDVRFIIEHPYRRISLLHRRWASWIGPLLMRDIDIAHFPCADIWYSRRGKTVVTIHDLAPLHFPQHFFKTGLEENNYLAHLNHIAAYTSTITAVSDFSRTDILNNLKISPEKVFTVHNCIDKLFLPPPLLGAGQEGKQPLPSPYFLFVGFMDVRKNVPLLLEAFTIYRQRGGSSNLVLIGRIDNSRPAYCPPIQPILDNMKESKNVFWFKDISDEALPGFYSKARGVLFISSFEGFGYPLIEAMASATPIIASREASIPEVAGNAAHYVEINPESVAAAMFRFDEDDRLRQELVQAGKKRLPLFLPPEFARKILGVYKKSLFL